MHPALSVIFFSTLSGAGFGLWAWLGLRIALGDPPRGFQALGWSLLLVAGGIAATVGLVASLWHLGKPLRAWRAFSQWRTSWLSREGVLALAAFVPAAALLWLLRDSANGLPPVTRLMALLLVVLSLATVFSTAMIYASLKPIPAWRHRLVPAVYLLFALLTGGLPMLASIAPADDGLDAVLPRLLAVIAGALLLAKLRYWRDLDRALLPQSRGDAVGLPGRRPSVFERPHTEDNFITREMAFTVARRHAAVLRVMAILLFAALPLLCLWIWSMQPEAALWWLALATAGALAGAFVERWLFFAQARHLVTLYY